MGDINVIYAAIKTSRAPASGGDFTVRLIINQLGWDRLNIRIINDDRVDGSFSRGECIYYRQGLPVGGLGTINDALLDSGQLYARILTLSDNLWKPELVFIWGYSYQNGYIPLAYKDNFPYVLSIDPFEGLSSAPVHRVNRGTEDMTIQKLLLIVTTSGRKTYAGTNSPIKLTITTDNGSIVVNHTIGDTTQTDLERWLANIYEVPVSNSFKKADILNGKIVLSIEGSDVWIPENIWLFGIDSTSSTPTRMIIISRKYAPGPLSLDRFEGQPSTELPIR